MAHLHNLKHNTNPSFLENLGPKVRTVAGVVGTAKGLYDVGKAIYSIGRAAIPIVESFL